MKELAQLHTHLTYLTSMITLRASRVWMEDGMSWRCHRRASVGAWYICGLSEQVGK